MSFTMLNLVLLVVRQLKIAHSSIKLGLLVTESLMTNPAILNCLTVSGHLYTLTLIVIKKRVSFGSEGGRWRFLSVVALWWNQDNKDGVIGILKLIERGGYSYSAVVRSTTCGWHYMSPKMPAKVLRRFFMVSSASSVSAALREPWRAKPPRPLADDAGAALLAVLGAADADDTVDDWDAAIYNINLMDWGRIISC